jgi:hypothetical protein
MSLTFEITYTSQSVRFLLACHRLEGAHTACSSTVYSPLSDHPYNRGFPLSDGLSGRETEGFV